jgi:hypothetical protein
MDKLKVKYVSNKKIVFKKLDFYPHGRSFPDHNGDNEIDISEREKKSILQKHNGGIPLFVIVRKKKQNTESEAKIEDGGN